jgi:hypothetical protein
MASPSEKDSQIPVASPIQAPEANESTSPLAVTVDGNHETVPQEAKEANESTSPLAVTVDGNHETVPQEAKEKLGDETPVNESTCCNIINGPPNRPVDEPTPNKVKQLRIKIVIWIFMVALSAFIFAWTYQILLAEIPSFGGTLVTSGSKSNVVITVLAQVFVQLVNLNLTSSFEVLGYQLASRREGVSMPTFLQLNQATTYLGSLSLSRICGKHYIWGIQR